MHTHKYENHFARVLSKGNVTDLPLEGYCDYGVIMRLAPKKDNFPGAILTIPFAMIDHLDIYERTQGNLFTHETSD